MTVDLGRRARSTADANALASSPLGRSRLAAGLRHPLALARRRGLLPGTERLVRMRAAAGLRAAIKAAAQMGDPRAGGIVVVCGDGLDHLAATGLARTRELRVAPGGIRWLGDQTASATHDGPVEVH